MTAILDRFTGALCRGLDSDKFFPEEFEVPDPDIIKLCWSCPIRESCLNWALSHDEVGIWGGLSEYERGLIQRRRHRVRCPDCRSDSVIEEGRFEVCLSCGLSWPV